MFILTLGHESALDDFGIYEFVAIPDHASGSRVCDFMLQTDRFFLFLKEYQMSALESFCQFLSAAFHSCFYDTLFITIIFSVLSLSLQSY